MLIRLLFATVFAAAVSLTLWAGASALIEPEPFVDGPSSVVRASQVQLCLDCEDDVPPPPPPLPPCEGWTRCDPPFPPPFNSPVFGGKRESQPLVRVAPRWPEACEGSARVNLTFDVAPDGKVFRAEVTSSTDSCFDDAAIAAVRKWRYTPSDDAATRTFSTTIKFVS